MKLHYSIECEEEKQMKKIIIGIILVLALTACDGGVNYKIPLDAGDIRITETPEYILTERCKGCNGFGTPIWEKVSVERKITAEQVKEENK